MTLGEQIKQAREEKNYSQEDLALKLGVSRQAISKWENDAAVPTGINREMLNQVLGLSLSVNDIDAITKGKNNKMYIVSWSVVGVLAVCLIVSLIYIKLKLNSGEEQQGNNSVVSEESIEQDISETLEGSIVSSNNDFMDGDKNIFRSKDDATIIENFILASNRQDIDMYLPLFVVEMKTEMQAFIDSNGAVNFFSGNRQDLISIRLLNEKYNADYEGRYLEENEKYGEVTCYLVKTENLTTAEEENNIYVIVTENNARRLVRVSATEDDYEAKYFE